MERVNHPAGNRKWAIVALAALAFSLLPAGMRPALAQGNSRTFTETGKTVSGKFLAYWTEHGGLAQQGLPISDEMQDQSPLDGKTYTMQYFERAVFEMHPENQAPQDVLLSLLGVFQYTKLHPQGMLKPAPTTLSPSKRPAWRWAASSAPTGRATAA